MKMTLNPIFSNNILSHYTSDFKLASVTNIREITLMVKEFVEELDSGKIESLKEEEIKPRFINLFFGDILGFNYGNSNKWLLREEKKSVVDGTKPDAALGYFFIDSSKDDVRAVIEIKDANTNLDEKQSRPDKLTPVEQAFSYVSKSGGNCKWVIVSNIKETRFYPCNDRSKCQVFLLKDLTNEKKLKELLFLFHKDRFIKESKQENSSTDKLLKRIETIKPQDDKPLHIIDKIYNSLKRFDGFGFIDPNFVVAMYPFNILDEHVWQYYEENLFTINGEIYNLLEGLNIENGEITFTNEMQAEISTSNVIDAKYKIEWAFAFLNDCLVNEITAIKDYHKVEERNKKTIGFSHRNRFQFKEGEEGITKSIKMLKKLNCDCLSCNYRSLDFNKLLTKLRTGEGNENYQNLEYAYGHYIAATNNFKTTYNIYKAIEKDIKGKQYKGVKYFLVKQNIKLLHNLIMDYHFDDSQEIMKDIKSVDLDRIIYDEIEFDVDNEVKKYLIDVKEDVLIYKLQDEVEEIVLKIENLKLLYENGGQQTAGPNLPSNLTHLYFLLYIHINGNFIIYDTFKRYKSLTEKVFKGLVTSYHTKGIGLQLFNDFYLTEAILHITPSSLQEILKKTDDLKAGNYCIEKLLEKLNNFTTSSFTDGFFGGPHENTLLSEQLHNHRFRDRWTNIFANQFTILSRLVISVEQFSKSKIPLLKFLKVEKELAWFDLKELAYFIIKKGYLFEADDLAELLKIAIDRNKYGNNKYGDLIIKIPQALVNFYPDFKIKTPKLIHTAVLKCSSDDGKSADYSPLIHLVNVCDGDCKLILLNVFEKYLDEKFDLTFYEELIRNSDYSLDTKNYFLLYSEQVNIYKNEGRAYKFGKYKLTELYFINYIIVSYKRQIDFNRNELKVFTNLNNFETWLLNPKAFDYTTFEPKWLLDLSFPVILDRIRNIEPIKIAIEVELKHAFNPTLAEIKYKYF